jgi:hypothetical protein
MLGELVCKRDGAEKAEKPQRPTKHSLTEGSRVKEPGPIHLYFL